MSDITPLNDPELNELEQRLAAATLTPDSRRRERLMYACGQAAGRSQMKRRVRAVSAAAVMLSCVSAGLGFLLIMRAPSQTNMPDPTRASVVEGTESDLPITVVRHQHQMFDHSRGRQLSAGTRYEELVAFNRRPKAGLLKVDPANFPTNRGLTAASRSWPDDLWD